MKRIVLVLVMLLCLTGCKATYELEIDDTSFKERINSEFNYKDLASEEQNSLSHYSSLNMDAFYNNSSSYLNKNINYKGNKAIIDINYDYNSSNFDNAYMINSCFDEHIFINDDNYYYLEVLGDFGCQYADEVEIVIKTNHVVMDTNATRRGNEYSWTLSNDNNKDVDMFIQLSKTQVQESGGISTFKIVMSVILLILCGLTVLAVKFIGKKDDGENYSDY